MVILQTAALDAVESIVTVDPISAILLLVGSLLIGVSMLVFGGLSIGAGIALLTPE